MKLHDWINIIYLNWDLLSLNKNTIEMLKENPNNINLGVFIYHLI